jgi:hypothetical protein
VNDHAQFTFPVIAALVAREQPAKCAFPVQEDRMLTRYRRPRAALVCGVTAIACAASSTLAQQDKLVFVPIRASEVMSAADRQQIGVEGLTPEQRLALDVWLTRYSAELRASALPQPQPGPARTILASASDDGPAAEPEAESYQRGDRRYRDRVWTPLVTLPPSARLVSTPEDGGFVRLADGTLWEVYAPDRTATVIWRAGDFVSVSRAPAAVGDYDHLLINAPARTRALARFVDLVPPRRR